MRACACVRVGGWMGIIEVVFVKKRLVVPTCNIQIVAPHCWTKYYELKT